jgi:dipeptidyl aminopeptidase/acylaminoacyl peptidase
MLTMYAVAFAPRVFQAAISLSGYGDVTDFHTRVLELQHIKLLDYELGKWPGDETTQAVYRRSSSIHKAAEVTTPTMLIHGYGEEASWRPSHDDYYPALEFARALD